MSHDTKLLLDYNSAYLSFKILDELDYVIGGYGHPTTEFIFTLNTFIETYVLNESFYTSEVEINHAKVTNRYYFPNGRPLLDAVLKEIKLGIITNLGNNISTAVYVEKFDDINSFSIDKGIENYFKSPQKQKYDEYVRLNTSFHEDKDVSHIRVNLNEDRLIIGATINSPVKIFQQLTSVSSYRHIQPVLPINTLQEQLTNVETKGMSNEIFETLCTLHDAQTKDVRKYFGYDHQALPPLVSILLSQCRTRFDIPEKLVQLRKDFTLLRKSIVNYEKRINEAQTIKEQVDAITEFNSFWDAFHKKFDNKTNRLLYRFWDAGKESDYETSIDNAVDNHSATDMLKDLNIGKVVGKLASFGVDWWKQRRILGRFKGITNAWDLFSKQPTITLQHKQIERIFGISVNDQELKRIKVYLDSVKKNQEV